MSRVLPQKASSILAIPGTATASEPAVLCVALADDKESERLLTAVVKEVALWEPAGVLATLHLAHVAFVPAEFAKSHCEKVRHFMQKRFVSILDRLPDSVDWQLHVIAINRSNYYGEPMRGNHNPAAKKLLAAALCKEAALVGATELVVNEKDHGQQYHKTLAHKVIKYSKVQVRVIGASGPVVHQGTGKMPNVPLALDNQDIEPLPADRARVPTDQTDVYSRFKALKRGFNNLLGGKSKTADSRTTYDPVN